MIDVVKTTAQNSTQTDKGEKLIVHAYVDHRTYPNTVTGFDVNSEVIYSDFENGREIEILVSDLSAHGVDYDDDIPFVCVGLGADTTGLYGLYFSAKCNVEMIQSLPIRSMAGHGLCHFVLNITEDSRGTPPNGALHYSWTIYNDELLSSADRTRLNNSASQNALDDEIERATTAEQAIADDVDDIQAVIPAQATETNKLADKDFVNSSLNSITAFYITSNAAGDGFETYANLAAATVFYSGGEIRVPTRNDYCIVRVDETKDNATTRYIFQNDQWEYQYTINETALTAAQMAALNSGITSGLVALIGTAVQPADLDDYLPKSGGQVTGTVSFGGTTPEIEFLNGYGEINGYPGTGTPFHNMKDPINPKDGANKDYVDNGDEWQSAKGEIGYSGTCSAYAAIIYRKHGNNKIDISCRFTVNDVTTATSNHIFDIGKVCALIGVNSITTTTNTTRISAFSSADGHALGTGTYSGYGGFSLEKSSSNTWRIYRWNNVTLTGGGAWAINTIINSPYKFYGTFDIYGATYT